MGPPAESEYAVDPVGVEMISPSALYSQIKLSPAQAFQIDDAGDSRFCNHHIVQRLIFPYNNVLSA